VKLWTAITLLLSRHTSSQFSHLSSVFGSSPPAHGQLRTSAATLWRAQKPVQGTYSRHCGALLSFATPNERPSSIYCPSQPADASSRLPCGEQGLDCGTSFDAWC